MFEKNIYSGQNICPGFYKKNNRTAYEKMLFFLGF